MEQRRPYVFIGSSTEGLPVAEAIQANLEHVCECHIWSQGVFGLGEGPMESLIRNVGKFDFSILVLTPDDIVSSRGKSKPSARDNVIFELGMFIGTLGRDRTFMVSARNTDMRLPSDLTGLEPATFQQPESGNLQSALGTACTRIKSAIESSGRRDRTGISVEITGGYIEDIRRFTGISFTIKNIGDNSIPPYKPCIYHPTCGTIFGFPSEVSGELLPDQEREHISRLFECGQPSVLWSNMETDRDGRPLTEEDDQKFAFRMVLEHSEKVLYEHRRLGLAFVRVVRKAFERGTLRHTTGEDLYDLRNDP
ncbi:TIR domain-containing protein [Planctomycetota bacterium]